MVYPEITNYTDLAEKLKLYTQLKHEYGSKNISPILVKAEKALKSAIKEINKLPIDNSKSKKEPNDLKSILKLRPNGPRKIWYSFNKKDYTEKLEGAFLGRCAGCTLGAPVEFWTIEAMKNLAKENKEEYPPIDYWKYVPDPYTKRYLYSRREEYIRYKMNGVPVDDDIAYTLLGLLAVEEYGINFTTEELGKAWVRYLPIACTAEEVALNNIKTGVPVNRIGETNNPYCEWIGAFIRADPWGYMAPGWPEKAAELAYRDGFLSHRRQGIYGEMFFAASIAAAFTVDDPVEALKIGLTEIPKNSDMAKGVKWALKVSPQIKNYMDARNAVEDHFKGMHPVHTINNACLTIFGITIGGTDFTKVISETVAMGMDNDCTAATAGSIVGAVIGKSGIPKHWYKNYNNTVHSYLIGKRKFSISGLIKRFSKQAMNVHTSE